ncbi:non-hydrolyzing UDP-N-acetylglucosamine 2-epimerase [Vampirovibrio chlorellavorus]|uniref:non-hydrolyzing UDP-N-acetylglucosamine 2-epimerase n=1 Tax=Vampirovibrio chlorellavorus TaxID=758823 RepID=UPI0026F236B5|nr:UDP-N-acetylglucosamine 2-epimerase (non-hydrolyzing) [Vampirovibrio chlorellavorus]
MTVFGTRPEAIKMAPVVNALAACPQEFESVVCVTAQHREMLDQVLDLFQIRPDYDLNLMKPNQDLFQITTNVLMGMKDVLEKEHPDVVLVHGDTTTTMATSLAAFYKQIPVGHVEAGLRTWDKYYPFPEEINRVVTDGIATLYFAPTERSRQNLLKTGAREAQVFMTGNTVIDALLYTLHKPDRNGHLPIILDDSKRLVLVTVHRRENFGEPMQEICRALKDLITEDPSLEMVIPVHPNPNVRGIVRQTLGDLGRIHLIDPLDYEPFCRLMERADIILTDSGGVQEEAPSLQKPVLVLRDETERPEAVEMGTVKLVGPHYDKILSETRRLLSDDTAYQSMARAINPYGDGKSSQRILDALRAFHENPTLFR